MIEPAMSEWTSPVLFASKKKGKERCALDYKKLNAVTVRNTYPLPRMGSYTDSLRGSAFLFTTNCSTGYYEVEVMKADRSKTIFFSQLGLLRLVRMAFGLKNAPASSVHAVKTILSSIKWQLTLVYQDGIPVYLKSVSDNLGHVRTVLTLLQNAKVALKLSTCTFFNSTVSSLRHMIRVRRPTVYSMNCEAVSKSLSQTSQKKLRFFSGIFIVHRPF